MRAFCLLSCLVPESLKPSGLQWVPLLLKQRVRHAQAVRLFGDSCSTDVNTDVCCCPMGGVVGTCGAAPCGHHGLGACRQLCSEVLLTKMQLKSSRLCCILVSFVWLLMDAVAMFNWLRPLPSQWYEPAATYQPEVCGV